MNKRMILARKYALAFVHSFVSEFERTDIEHIAQAYQFLNTHKRFSYFLNLSAISSEQKKSSLEKILITQFQLPKSPCSALITLLIAHNRTFLIAPILRAIYEIMMLQKNIAAFTITSAQELTQNQRTEVEQFLTQGTSKKIIPTYKLNKDLIAGLRMQSNAHLWEHSLKKYLRTLICTFTR